MATVEALKDKREIELMKTVLKQKNLRYYLLFVLGTNTGLRIGDLLRLKLEDLVQGEKRTVRKHLMGVTKRGKDKWQIEISMGFDADGKRRWYRETFTGTETKAKKREAELKVDNDRGVLLDSSSTTLEEFSVKWLKYINENGLAPKTIQEYESMLRTRVLPALGKIKLNKIKPLNLVEFYSELRKEGSRIDGKPGRLSEQRILHHHRLIHTLLEQAVKWDFVPSNPASKVKAPKPQKKEMPVYNLEQVEQLIEELNKESLKYRAIVLLTLNTGARKGEIMGLDWSDIDFDEKILHISKSSQYLPGKGSFVKAPKNESSKRIIAISENIIDILKAYQEEQRQDKESAGDLWIESGRVFTQVDGTPMHPDTMSKWFPNFVKRHNMPKLTFHGLRHTNATILIEKGLHAKVISKRLGHANIGTTMNVYGHVLKSADRGAAEVIDAVISKARVKEDEMTYGQNIIGGNSFESSSVVEVSFLS